MPTIRHILFPVDFSEQNRGMAAHAQHLAARYQARVTLLHVMQLTSAYPGWPAFDFQAIAAQTKQRIDSFLTSHFHGIATTRLVTEGDPAQEIVDYAGQQNVDLIMMPTHGYGPFRRFILGSVTAKVLHDAKCPVWTSAHVEEAPVEPTAYRTVLCAVDLTPKSLPLTQWASGFASEQGAGLKLVHAVAAPEDRPGIDIEGGKFREFLFDVARGEFAKLQKAAGTNFETVLEAGDVARVVRKAAEKAHADLVVIGRGVVQEPFGRMRTHVYSIIREAPCPVVSV